MKTKGQAPPVGTTTVVVEGQTLRIFRIVNGDSGKVTVTLAGGQEITYRPPAADLIRDAFKATKK